MRGSANPAGFAAGPADLLRQRALASTVVLGVNLIFLGILLLATVWRETPDFWRNAGGYAVVLREGVRFGYYPLLGLSWVLLHGSAATLWRCRSASPVWVRWGLAVACFQALLLCIVFVLAFGNNFMNFLEGRPLHWRAG